METTIHFYNAELPAFKIAQEQLLKAQEAFTQVRLGIKAQYELAYQMWKETIQKARESVRWDYEVVAETIKESGRVTYRIKATTKDVVEGDEKFTQPRIFSSFFIIHNVIIRTGGGFVIPVQTGDVVDDLDIYSLDSGKIPNSWLDDNNQMKPGKFDL